METKENLQKQLNSLIVKWKGKVPTSFDKLWWKFKCDRTIALRLRDQITYYETYVEREKKIEEETSKDNQEMETYKEIFK